MPKHIGLLLDESGSMAPVRDDLIAAINEFLGNLKGQNEARITITTFDGSRTPAWQDICVGVPIADVPVLSYDNYCPGGSTPLFDSVAHVIDRLRKRVGKGGDPPLMVIYTDGMENASQKFNRDQIQQKVAKRIAAGWDILFLGADMDAWTGSGSMGLTHAGSTLNVRNTKRGLHATATVITQTSLNYLGGMSAAANANWRDATYGDTVTDADAAPPVKRPKTPSTS